MKKTFIAVLFLLTAIAAFPDSGKIGIHGGAGTDINLGIAAGGGISYLLNDLVGIDMEAAVYVFYSHTVDKYTEGIFDNRYTETTDMLFFTVLANMLYKYDPKNHGIFFIAGVGAMAVSLEWVIESTDDPTANDSLEGTNGGLLLNPGLGYTFGNGFELRIQVPVFFVFTEYETLISPLLVAIAGFRF